MGHPNLYLIFAQVIYFWGYTFGYPYGGLFLKKFCVIGTLSIAVIHSVVLVLYGVVDSFILSVTLHATDSLGLVLSSDMIHLLLLVLSNVSDSFYVIDTLSIIDSFSQLGTRKMDDSFVKNLGDKV